MVGLAILGCCKHGPNSLHQSKGLQACCFHVSRFLCAALVGLSPGWTEKRRLCWPLEVGSTSCVKSHFRYLLDEVVSKMEQNSLSSLRNLAKTLCNGKLCWLSDRFDFARADSFLHLHVPGSTTAWGVARASVFSNHLATKQLKRNRQCWGLVKLEMRMVWLGANSPSVFISRTNRWEDWISDCLIVTFIFPRLEHLAKFKSIVLTLDIYFRMLPWQNSQGFGRWTYRWSYAGTGWWLWEDCRCGCHGPRTGLQQKSWSLQMTLLDHYRSAIGASAICLFGWRHKGLKPALALAGTKTSGWSWAIIVFICF